MAMAGAPRQYLAINAAALAAGLGWIAIGRLPQSVILQRSLALVLLALLFVPLVTGPTQTAIGGAQVTRWIPLGPITVNAGLLALPAILVLAVRDEAYAPPILFTALLAASLQPDGALGFAITFAAVGLHHVTRDWKLGLVAIIGFFAAIVASLEGELPPARFVEHVFRDAGQTSVLAALALAVCLAAAFFAILYRAPLARAERYAVAGALFGFTIASLMNSYPTPLLGYGAAPVIGFGLALGLGRGKVKDNAAADAAALD